MELDTSRAPWLIAGDFNCIDKAEDKLGGKPFIIGNSLRAFKDLCRSSGLIDLSFYGMRYTWCNNRTGSRRIHARLDKEINSRVRNKWDSTDWNNCSIKRFGVCLSKLGKNLTCWSKKCVDSLESNLKSTLCELEVLEMINEKGQCSDTDLLKLISLTNKANALNRQIHLKWWSKVREKWIDQNDKNIKYFHSLVKFKRRANTIHEIRVGSETLTEPKRIANAFAVWYKDLWNDNNIQNEECQNIENLNWKKIPTRRHEALVKEFSLEEIWQAISKMGRGKAPGSDGFTVEFFVHYWNSLGKVTLLNSVANSIHVHSLATTWINDKLIERHNKSVRRYLWSSSKKKKGAHLVNWKCTTMRKYEGGLGVKDLSITKFSIKAKRILPFLNKDKALWVKLLHARYPYYHPWFYGKASKFSWTFKSIHNAILQLRDGLMKQIGNGKDTSILEDPGVSSIPIGKWPTFVNEKQWNPVPSEINWVSLWEMNCIPKIKTFAWKLIWKRIPTSNYFAKFNGNIINNCPVCMNGEDSQDHLFFECPFATSYCITAGKTLGVNFEHFSNCKDGLWLLEGKNFDKENGNKLNGFIGASLWHLRKNRNEIFYNKKKLGINTILNRAFANTSSSSSLPSKDKILGMSVKEVSTYTFSIGEKQPKIFCDAAWFSKSSKAHEDEIIGECSSSKIVSSTLHAEL
ncbi:hypothetical protein Cni_G03074 [Canna indica]|uniref:Reverse transcriptase zinc-binding domain-containing protein n=1 Tax=Canna indica TaxID=4628 RepID=A0AAQ3Q381_9LILI|nr:hypothetical protein Cni_G03074 [Canna indica]